MSSQAVSVRAMLEQANKSLRSPYQGPDKTEESARAWRMGVCFMVESVLMAADMYAGFGYQTPYIEGETDESRRVYYYSPKLTRQIKRPTKAINLSAGDKI